MNFSRKTIFVVGAALLAACGDKVTVEEVQQTPPTPKVNFVEVTPGTATLNIGQTITLTAAVNADAGLATTVTWASSDASKASVSSAGVVTAVAATPGVAICATSTVDTGKKGCASIVVSPVTPTIPATVSINSIQVTGALGGATANPANIANAIDVTLNVNPGNQTITKVELLVGGKIAGTQTFTAAQSAALRYAADEAIAAQTTFPQVVFSVNTAAFDAATGAPTWLNGTQTLQGKVYTSAATATASVSQNLTFNNVNTFAVTTTVGGTTATANNAAGYRFTKGDVMVSVLPISYSGVALASATINFGVAACDLSGTAQRTKALTAPATGSAWTATFANSGAAGAANATNYEYSAACASLATGEQVSIQTAQDATGNPFTTAALPANFGAGFRLDNRAPGAPAVFVNPDGRLSGWVNDAVSFNTIQAAANLNGMITAAIADAGVGGVTYAARVGDYSAGTVAAAIAAADVTSPATLAASVAPTSYCLVVYSVDALGNRTASPGSATACAATTQSTTIGVDRAAPTIAPSGGLASNARISTATVAAEFQVTVSDTGTVGNSGMNSANSVMGTVTLRNATATGAATCLVGTYAAATGCSAASVNAAPAFPLVPTTVIAANASPGYFTYTGQARDAAGNLSGAVTRVIVHDDAATAPVVVFSTPLLPGTLNPNSFVINNVVSDNLDIRDFQYTFTYGATMGGFPFEGTAQTAVNGFNATPLINSSYNATYSGSILRQVQEWTGAPWTVGAASAATTATVIVRDQGGSAGTTLATVIPGGTFTITSPTDYATVVGGSNWVISNAATSISTGATSPAANALSVTLNADLEGATATFNSPFARVDFYVLSAANIWVKIGTTSSPVTTDNGVLRRHRYSFAWTPGTTFPVGAKSIRAVGVNAANDALSSTTNTNITLTNP